MAPAAKDTTSKKDDKKTRKDAAKSKDSVEKEPSVELTEEEQLEESRKAVEEMMGVSVYEALQHERQKQAEAGKRRASVSRFMYVGKLAEGSSDEDVLAQTKAVVDELDAAVEDSPWNQSSVSISESGQKDSQKTEIEDLFDGLKSMNCDLNLLQKNTIGLEPGHQ
jgi:hypothetical protein